MELFRMAKAGELGTLLQVEANFSQDKFLELKPDNWRLSNAKRRRADDRHPAFTCSIFRSAAGGPRTTVLARVSQLTASW
jgi:hypothetical protein